MNALHLPDFHRAWVDAGLAAVTAIYINLLTTPAHYRVQVLPQVLKEQVRARYREHIDGFLRARDPHGHVIRQFEAALKFMDEQDLSSQLETFRWYTQRLDQLRGERFDQIFPELGTICR